MTQCPSPQLLVTGTFMDCVRTSLHLQKGNFGEF